MSLAGGCGPGVSAGNWSQDGSSHHGFCLGGGEWHSSGHTCPSYHPQAGLDAERGQKSRGGSQDLGAVVPQVCPGGSPSMSWWFPKYVLVGCVVKLVLWVSRCCIGLCSIYSHIGCQVESIHSHLPGPLAQHVVSSLG